MSCVGTNLGGCNFKHPINTHPNLDDKECQKQCENMPLCKFYTYNFETRDCIMFEESLGDYLNFCKTIDSPKECQPQPVNCVSFSKFYWFK